MDRTTVGQAIRDLAKRAAAVATEPAPGRPDRVEYLERFAITALALLEMEDLPEPLSPPDSGLTGHGLVTLRKHIRYLAETDTTDPEMAVHVWLGGEDR